MSNNYLVHHGILGQKWGVRRFQNPDGTYTEEGKRRQARMNKAFTPSIKGGKDNPNVSPAERSVKEARKAVNEAENLVGIAEKYRKRPISEKAKTMSDKELRDAINRIQLERQYTSLTEGDISSGFEVAKDVLSGVGSVLAIATSGLIIAQTIKSLK